MFKHQVLDERSKILWKKKLCYGIYSPVSQDHNAKSYKQRRTCKICKQSHPAGLHRYLSKKKQPKVTSNSKDDVPLVDNKKMMTSNFAEMYIKCYPSSIESKIINMWVVSVKASHSKSKKTFLRMRCSAITVKGRSSKKTFIKHLEQLAEKLILWSRLSMDKSV